MAYTHVYTHVYTYIYEDTTSLAGLIETSGAEPERPGHAEGEAVSATLQSGQTCLPLSHSSMRIYIYVYINVAI